MIQGKLDPMLSGVIPAYNEEAGTASVNDRVFGTRTSLPTKGVSRVGHLTVPVLGFLKSMNTWENFKSAVKIGLHALGWGKG